MTEEGIDYRHPTFIDERGNSRIAYFWNQAATGEEAEGRMPVGYDFGAQYSGEELSQSLRNEEIIPGTESGSGHGTAVAGIAAGNGNGSAGNRYRGIATESELIVVKIVRSEDRFAGSTEVMMGVDYAIRKAIALQKPIAINLSFGNNYGAHDGNSLFEGYLTELNGVWKNVIVVATGNEGDARHHRRMVLEQGEEEISFVIGARERNLSLQIWKNYVDEFSVVLETPSGNRIPIIQNSGEAVVYQRANQKIVSFYGMPTPYTIKQEIFIEWLSEKNTFLESGVWKLIFFPEKIVNGLAELWMPTTEAIGLATGFLTPTIETTLTIPSTARKIITVGAYDVTNDSIPGFSGRGYTADGRLAPNITAPGKNIVTALVGGGYGAKTGTSVAAPFVTGSAALLMEWGIVRGRDPYLYGEKVKAFLEKGARRLSSQQNVPDASAGYGALCVRESLKE